MIKLFLVVFCFALVACSGTRQVSQSETKTEISREKTVTYKDTVISVPTAKTVLNVPVLEIKTNLLQPRIYRSKDGNASAELRIENDTVFVTAKCDSLAIRAQLKNELIQEREIVVTEISNKSNTGISGFRYYASCIIMLLAGVALGIILKMFII